MKLEVCVDTYSSFLTAIRAGADRIELCSALSVGGLTPSYGLMKQAIGHKEVEIFVMIRPRGGDFLYDKQEFETMKEDIRIAKEMGFHGIVCGILKEDGTIDFKKMEVVKNIAEEMKISFHRAIDVTENIKKSISQLIELGCCRVLTSGQKSSAKEGFFVIRELQKEFGNQITIMPGAGINQENIDFLIQQTGCTEYHMSGKMEEKSKMKFQSELANQQTVLHENIVARAQEDRIRTVRVKLK